jgi:hypothetical protein
MQDMQHIEASGMQGTQDAEAGAMQPLKAAGMQLPQKQIEAGCRWDGKAGGMDAFDAATEQEMQQIEAGGMQDAEGMQGSKAAAELPADQDIQQQEEAAGMQQMGAADMQPEEEAVDVVLQQVPDQQQDEARTMQDTIGIQEHGAPGLQQELATGVMQAKDMQQEQATGMQQIAALGMQQDEAPGMQQDKAGMQEYHAAGMQIAALLADMQQMAATGMQQIAAPSMQQGRSRVKASRPLHAMFSSADIMQFNEGDVQGDPAAAAAAAGPARKKATHWRTLASDFRVWCCCCCCCCWQRIRRLYRCCQAPCAAQGCSTQEGGPRSLAGGLLRCR